MHLLRFTRIHAYAGADASITVPVVLRLGANVVDLTASVDTGASCCLFENAYAFELGVDPASGIPRRFQTAKGSFEAFGHELEIEVLGAVTHSLVYSFADPWIAKNVLRRAGSLDRIRLGVIDYDRELFLAPYDEHAE